MVVAYRKKKYTKFKTGLITIYIYSIATVAIFEISTLKFIKFQSFARKKKCQNLEPKIPYLDLFGIEF